MSNLPQRLSDLLRAQHKTFASAESCTGGMIGAAITDLTGSSDVFERGFITYSNQAKIEMLGVKEQTLDSHGAVSEQTAKEMVLGALDHSKADLAVAVTGIAGPSGGSEEKPVGLVYIAVAEKEGTPIVLKNIFEGDRHSIRAQTVEKALSMLINLIEK